MVSENEAVIEFQVQELKAKRESYEQARSDPQLRIAAVHLVTAVHDALVEAAAELAKQRGDLEPFAEDECRAELLWQLLEFLAQGHFEDECLDNSAKHFQLTEGHAAVWFNVGIRPGQELVAS